MEDEIPVRPVAGWTAGPVPSLGIGVLMFRYLASPMESPEQAHASPNFAMTAAQLRELAQRMLDIAAKLESSPESGSGHPKH